MPILSGAFDDVLDAPVDVDDTDDELLLLVPPQAAIHSPHKPHSATADSVRGSRFVNLSNLVTS